MDALSCKQCHDDYRVKKPAGTRRGMRLLWLALAAFACGASADDRLPPSGPLRRTAANCRAATRARTAPLSPAAAHSQRPSARSTRPTSRRIATPASGTGARGTEARSARGHRRRRPAPVPGVSLSFLHADDRTDIADLYAFLRTLKPVRYVPPGNDAAFSMRWTMAPWKAMNLDPGAYHPDPAQTPEWNRGAYLVQGPGHCGACHTPRTWTLAEQPRPRFGERSWATR